MAPTIEEFLTDWPLYRPVEWDDAEWSCGDLRKFLGPLDSYCTRCGRDSVFGAPGKEEVVGRLPGGPGGKPDTVAHNAWQWDLMKHGPMKFLGLGFVCSRSDVHRRIVVCDPTGSGIRKIGQSPSPADLHKPALARYRKVLGEQQFDELTRATLLHSHDVGIGAFVYLRRIFETLVREAEDEALEAGDLPEDYESRQLRMPERVAALAEYLPPFLVEHSDLYSILSKGIHELTEGECLAHFAVVQNGIEATLEERLAERQREARAKNASSAINKLRSELRGPDGHERDADGSDEA